jgi:membrane fusion protein
MEQPLFRPEVSETTGQQWLGSVRLAYPVSHQLWTLISISIGIIIFIWLFTGHYTRRVHVTGLLVPQTGLITISANSTGIVDKIFISEGGQVHKGASLMLISGEHASRSLGDTSASVSAQLEHEAVSLRQDIWNTQELEVQQVSDNRLQQRMLRGQIEQLMAQITIASRQTAMVNNLKSKWAPLVSKGYISLLQFEQEQSLALSDESQYKSLIQQRYSTQQQLSALNDQLAQLPLTTLVKINELQRQLSQIEQTLAQNEATRDSVLRAPSDGIISSLLVRPGETAQVGQALLAIVPNDASLQAQVLVPSQAIGFVHPGTEVVLHYQAFPYQKFGLQKGKVLTVSRSALSPNEVTLLLGGGQNLSTDPLYLVRVDLTSQKVRAYGRDEPLRPGMALDADMLLDRRLIFEWLFEPLLGMGHWVKAS